MRRWERRLKDLALSLDAVGSKYYDPELFRLNANQFLTTSRTVSFLFQKDKENIAEFASWHAQNIAPWGNDKIMKWSIVSRNTIEKEGDLDLLSNAKVTLIVGYLEECDIPVQLDRRICLGVNIKKLIRLARAKLPSAVTDSSVIKLERIWIANTLPDLELLQAFRYIYARMYEACASLAKHLDTELEPSIPHPTSFDEASSGSRGVHYIKTNSSTIFSVATQRRTFDKNFVAPDWLIEIRERQRESAPKNLESLVRAVADIAEPIFLKDGHHVPMLWLFNEKFESIDFISTAPSDQSDKYIFWRSIPERIHYLKARYLVWVAEAWLRSGYDPKMMRLTRSLPITGEILQIVGIDGTGNSHEITWEIERNHPEAKPTLKPFNSHREENEIQANYLVPAIRALENVSSSHSAS